MRLMVVLTLAVLMVLAFALDVAAQRGSYDGRRYDDDSRFDRDRFDRDRYDRDRFGPGAKFDDRPYFTPTPWPFQGSYTRGWQQKLERVWGNEPAYPRYRYDDRYRYFNSPDDRWYRYQYNTYPWPSYECWGSRCVRTMPPFR